MKSKFLTGKPADLPEGVVPQWIEKLPSLTEQDALKQLTDRFDVTYLPDLASCVKRSRETKTALAAATVELNQPPPSDAINDPVAKSDWFLCSDFTDPIELQTLSSLIPNARIMGYPAFVQCMLTQAKWTKPRAVFNFAMLGAVVCITGYRDKQIVNKLATLIRWMGGSVQRNLSVTSTTHLVAFRCAGEKVRAAALATRRIVTVKASWVNEAWQKRAERHPPLQATDSDFVATHRAKVFQQTCIAFIGFQPGSDDFVEMRNLVLEHDGLITDDFHDERLTHVVVTDAWPGHGNVLDQLKQLLPYDSLSTSTPASKTAPLRADASFTEEDQYRVAMLGTHYRVPVLRLEWFWLSVQLTCLCRLEHYLYVAGPSRPVATISTHPILPPLAKLSTNQLEANETESPASMMPVTTSLLNIDESIVEEEEEGKQEEEEAKKPATPGVEMVDSPIPIYSRSLSASEPQTTRTTDELSSTDHRLPSEYRLRLDSSSIHSPDQSSTRSALVSPRSSKRNFSPFASSTDKVSFITSPRHRNSPRGFISPLAEASCSSSSGGLFSTSGRLSHSRRRGKQSASLSSSHDDLLTQLADPLSFPSNRERKHQLTTHIQASGKADGLFTVGTTGPCSPGSFNSGVLLNATNASECSTTDTPMGRSGFPSLHEVNGWMAATGATVDTPSRTQLPSEGTKLISSDSKLAVGSVAMLTSDQEQLSTPVQSGKRKSGRPSLLHSTVRKSRTPGLSELSSTETSVTPSGITATIATHLSVAELASSPAPDTPVQIRLEKRQHRIFEFFVTERNYLDILRYLYREAYAQAVDDEQSGGAILPRQEADFVFGKLGPIVELHERLQPHLNQLEANWSLTESRLGDALPMSLLEEIDKIYGNYMQFYSPPHVHHLGEQFPRFLAFMKQVERRKESGRQGLLALLVRPVQRLPSISLLMEGIAKFTPPSHPDHMAVTQFSKGLNNLLSHINDRLRKNEERLALLSLHHDINGAPPEMVSSSRSLVARLNVFELGTSSSGNTTCEPVTLFLLTDCLEVARPRRRHTGEPLAHAISAALAAVQGENAELNADTTATTCEATATSTGSLSTTATSDANTKDTVNRELTASSTVSTTATKVSSAPAITVTRTGSGASGSSMLHWGRSEGKQRPHYNHVYFLKLQEIKRVVHFDTASPDRAAFGLVVRATAELDDRVHAYCLAASFAASAAVATGRCPEPVELAMAENVSNMGTNAMINSSINFSVGGANGNIGAATAPQGYANTTTNTSVTGSDRANHQASVATLQACVSEAKRVFLNRLCHQIVQVSCLANTPEELLVDVQPEELLGFDLEQVFNATAMALKSKKFSRQLTRNISIKTPRRPIVTPQSKHRMLLNSTAARHTDNTTTSMDSAMMGGNPIMSPRRSVLGSLLGHRSTTTLSYAPDPTMENGEHLSSDRSASTPLPLRSGPPPTTDQVALAMVNLFQTTPRRARSPIVSARGRSAMDNQMGPMNDAASVDQDDIIVDDVDLDDIGYPADCPDVDCLSVMSNNLGAGGSYWPSAAAAATTTTTKRQTNAGGYPRFSSLTRNHAALTSSTSLRSLDPSLCLSVERGSSRSTTRRVTNTRNSLSRPTGNDASMFGVRGSALFGAGQRKSVCQSVLAGLKNFRRSIAGAGNALMHPPPTTTTTSMPTSRLGSGCSGIATSGTMTTYAGNAGILNRSASVDTGVCTSAMLAAASPLAATSDLCRSGPTLYLQRPTVIRSVGAPLAETELEREDGGSTSVDSSMSEVVTAQTGASFLGQSTRRPGIDFDYAPAARTMEDTRIFPRSMTLNVGSQGHMTPKNASLRSLLLLGNAFRHPHTGSGSTPRGSQSRPQAATTTTSTTTSQQVSTAVAGTLNHRITHEMNFDHETDSLCDLDEEEGNSVLGGSLAGSTLSLANWDSLSTLDLPHGDAADGFPLSSGSYHPLRASAVWETASHLGVSTADDFRRSFRLPNVGGKRRLGSTVARGSGLDKNSAMSNAKSGKKKSRSVKLGVLGQWFNRPQTSTRGTTEVLQTVDLNRKNTIIDPCPDDLTVHDDESSAQMHQPHDPPHQRSVKPNPSRRESLLRGIFSRQ